MSSTIKNVLCKTCLILIVGFTFLTASYAHAQQETVVLRVDGDNGSLPPPQGIADGTAWGTAAFRLLQDALAEAEEILVLDPNTPVHLWVAATILSNPYRPDRDAANPGGTANPNATFLLDFNNIRLLGGFAGNEIDPDDRDPALYETVLSGELGACGDPIAGNCFEENGSIGCDDLCGGDPCPGCCALVCDLDPFCCVVEWIAACVDLAMEFCLPPLGGGPTNAYHVVTADGVDDSVHIDGFTITDGRADGAGSNRLGGGMFISNASPAVVRVTFTENSAPGHGGGAMAIEGSAHPLIVNCSMTANIAIVGGAIHIDSTPASATLVNCLISGNTASSGGAIDARSSSPATLDLINCTVTDNTAQNSGGGIWVFGTMEVTITNSILWGNVPDQIDGEATVTYSDVEGGWPGEGNLDPPVDPMFVAPGTNYRLAADSPCIDVGDPNEDVIPDDTFDVDQDGNTTEPTPDLDLGDRVVDGDEDMTATVDMGAYESVPCPADLDGDCKVGVKDLLIFLGNWGPCADCNDCPADFDGDCVVGVIDLLTLLSSWGPCQCNPGAEAPSIQEAVEDAGLTWPDDWLEFLDALGGPEEENYYCWMDHYLDHCETPVCTEALCPDNDPFGGHRH